VLPWQDATASIVTDVATHLMVGRRIERVDDVIAAAFKTHPQAELLLSTPDIGIAVAAELALLRCGTTP
jgi:hypothetical protein